MRKFILAALANAFFVFKIYSADISATVVNCVFPTCNAGSIDIHLSTGVEPFSYVWSGPNGYQSTNEDLKDLSPGDYYLTVTDAQCGILQTKYTVSLSQSNVFIFSKKNISECGENWHEEDGAITISVPPGNFTFKWTGPNNYSATTQNISNLKEIGQYTVEISNSLGCKVSLHESICCCSIEIDAGTPPFVPPSDWKCGALSTPAVMTLDGEPHSPYTATSNEGSIDLIVTGGYPGKYYNWTGPNGFNSHEKNLTGLGPGNYCVTVTDGCSELSKCFKLTVCSEAGLFFLANQSNTCTGYATGGIAINNVVGGSSPYKMKWSNGQTGFNISGLAAGQYCATLTDAAGCTKDRCFTISNGTLSRDGCTILCDGKVIDIKKPIKDVFHEDNCTLVDHYCSDGYYLSTEFVGLKDIDIDQNNCVLTAICFNGEVYVQSFGINCTDCIFEVFNGGVYCCNVAYCYFPDFDISFVKKIKERQSVSSTQFIDQNGNTICGYQVFDDCNGGVELESGVVDCDEIPYFNGNCNEGFQEGDLLNGSFPNCFGLLTSAKKTMIDSNILAYFAKQEIKSTKIDWSKLNSVPNLGLTNSQTIFFDSQNGSTYDLEFNSTFEGLVQIQFQQADLKKSTKLDFHAQNGLNKLHFDSNFLSNLDLTNFNIEVDAKDYDFDLIRAKFSKSNFTFQNKVTEPNSFTLFPNPVSNELSVICNLKNSISPNFRIFNIFGQAFLTKNVVDSKNENLFQLDLTEIPNGIYFLEITTTEQTPTIQKFIIQK